MSKALDRFREQQKLADQLVKICESDVGGDHDALSRVGRKRPDSASRRPEGIAAPEQDPWRRVCAHAACRFGPFCIERTRFSGVR